MMRRYTPLFWLTFILLVAVLAGSTYLAGYADHKDRGKERLVVYTTLPVEHAAVLAQEYEQLYHVRVDFEPMAAPELLRRARAEAPAPRADVVLADSAVLRRLKEDGLLAVDVSEQTDIVAKRFKDKDGQWVGVWYDPIVFCVNRDYLRARPQAPTGWADLAKDPRVRLSITDFLATDASANLLYTFVSEYGTAKTMRFWAALHPRMVQYAKFLSTPVRMAGMGEADVAIAVQSESIRYVNDGFPLTVVYPREGTAFLLTGAALVKGRPLSDEGRHFIDWLLGDDAQMCMQQNRFFFMPTNQELVAYKTFTNSPVKLLANKLALEPARKQQVLNEWMKNVRFTE